MRHLAVPALAAAVVASLPLASADAPQPTADRWTPLTPAKVSFNSPTGSTVKAQLLGFNDFHGNIDPPTGSGGLVNGVPAGGSEYLATAVRKLRKEAGRTPTLTVGAGDTSAGRGVV